MILAVLIIMGLLALTAMAFWILAIRISYRIERLRRPDLPRPRLVMTNMFATAFMTTEASPEELSLQRQLRLRLAISVGCLIATAVLSFFLPVLPRQPAPGEAQAATSTLPPSTYHPVGTTLAYIRSNQDGSLPERIYVHIPNPGELHVAKMVDACKDAAFVIARIGERAADPVTTELPGLVGGQLQRDATQAPQAWLDLNETSRTLAVRLGDPKAAPVTFDAPSGPWRMYDFDLAEFALFGPRATRDFSFGLALAWPEENAPLLRILGEAKAKFLYTSEGGAKNHFRISGPAFADVRAGDRGGEMITDATFGHVIEARFGLPNHPGYSNFMLRLVKVTPGAEGEAEWRNALARHWQGCPD
jgi:hypothetical protein